MTSSEPKMWLWIFCPQMTLHDIPKMSQIGVKVNDAIHFWVDLEIRQLISMSDPTLFDNDFKIKMAWDYP